MNELDRKAALRRLEMLRLHSLPFLGERPTWEALSESIKNRWRAVVQAAPPPLGAHCKDCKEPIIESERRASIICKGCGQPMHQECAVYSDNEDAFCELCLHVDSKTWRAEMKALKTKVVAA